MRIKSFLVGVALAELIFEIMFLADLAYSPSVLTFSYGVALTLLAVLFAAWFSMMADDLFNWIEENEERERQRSERRIAEAVLAKLRGEGRSA